LQFNFELKTTCDDGCSSLIAGQNTASVQSNPVATAVARRNLMVMKRKWGDLVAHTDEVLQDKLDKKEITSNRFRHVLGITCIPVRER